MQKSPKHLIGIDEAGRGPLAGPVAVGVVCVPLDFNWELLPGVDDSKKLSEKKREVLFKEALKLHKEGLLAYSVSLESAACIDKEGIVHAVRKAMETSLYELEQKLSFLPSDCKVVLDGSLYAPETYSNQETIIKGDSKEKVIGLASIMAKVTRDRFMVAVSEESSYAVYDFAVHKGYGTKRHCSLISKHGLSSLHRKSFCTRLIM